MVPWLHRTWIGDHRLRRCVLYYLGYFGVIGVFLPYMNVFFVQRGLNGWEVGLLGAAAPLMTLVVAPPITLLAERRGWRVRTLTLALLGTALTFVFLWYTKSFVGLMLLMLLMSLFRSPTAALGDSMVVQMASSAGGDYGRLRMWGSLSFAVIAALCGLLWQRVGYVPMFLLAGLLTLPVAWFATRLDEAPQQSRNGNQTQGSLRFDAQLVLLLIATFLVGGALNMHVTFGGIAMHELGGNALEVGLLLSLSALGEMPGMRCCSALSRRLPGFAPLLLSYGLIGVAILLAALASTPALLLASGVIKGLGFGLFVISTIQVIHERAPDGWAATLQSILNAASWGLAPLIASPIAGAIYDSWGAAAVFVGATLLVAAAMALLLAMMAGRIGARVSSVGELAYNTPTPVRALAYNARIPRDVVRLGRRAIPRAQLRQHTRAGGARIAERSDRD